VGALKLPASGPVYLDANGFIYSAERIEPYAGLLQPLWEAAQEGRLEIVSSELVILETLVKPLRERDDTLQALFRELLFNAREVCLIPATTAIWEKAAQLRASLGLKTPDAVHAASALVAESKLLVTNDPHFQRVEELPVLLLSQFLEDEETHEDATE
jgi:predicted nucleic acid-binding protein